MKPLELPDIASVELDRLFPFHIILLTDNWQIIKVGPGLETVIGHQPLDAHFSELFDIKRPRDFQLELNPTVDSAQSFVLCHRQDSLNLRGMFLPISEKHILFAGSIVVESSTTLKDHGLKSGDFSPADPTPDMVIFHRFRDLQMQDQQKQIKNLQTLVEARDIYNHDAHTDELTGIANRRLFWNKGAKIIRARPVDKLCVILLMDLDGFKKINDRFGHEAGDQVLKVVAQRCHSLITDNDIAARLGGDEFAILCTCSEIREIEQLIDKLIDELKKPIKWHDRPLMINASLGASFVSDKQSIDEALQRADLAMYQGRKDGNGFVTWFTAAMQRAQTHRNTIIACIEQAIDNKEIIPHYQPIVDLQNGSLHGFEALARWHHTEYGMIYPDQFIEMAAEAGCLHKLDLLILESSLDQIVEWEKSDKRYNIHVNLSGTSVLPGLDSKVMKLLKQRGLTTDRLNLELTETTVLNSDRQTKDVLSALTEKGIAIQLDDFGTGYSSLTHLHDLPISGIKIDRSFLFNFPDDARSIALIETVMDIAMRLGLDVVAEGIETDDQSHWITSIGSRFGQGYLFGKPASASECESSALSWLDKLDHAA